MTNEQKLKRLLEIAIENGWEDEWGLLIILKSPESNAYIAEDCNLILYDEKGEFCDEPKSFSINDLATNFEWDKISFIEALFTASRKSDIVDAFSTFLADWISNSTSERLDLLFDTFAHLLV